MGSKYTTQSATNYNASPPADDGTVSEANKTKWSTIKAKLGDPLNTFAGAINTALLAALDTAATSKSANYTTALTDHLKPIECTGSPTIKLNDAGTMTAGYQVPIANVGSGTVTVALQTSTDTLDGVANDTMTLLPGNSATFAVNAGANGYTSIARGLKKGAAPFAQSLGENGYVTLPGGLILQWGSYNELIPNDDFVTITLPHTFPTAFVSIQSTPIVDGGTESLNSVGAQIISTSQFSISNTSAAPATEGAYWFAVGY